MSRKRLLRQVDDTHELQDGQVLCTVRGIASANVFECWDGLSDNTILAELPPRFRKTLWIRRGSYVVVTLFENSPGDAAGKQQGEIASILQSNHIKKWKKNGTWPSHFESELANTAQDKLDDQGQVEPSDNPDSPPSESDDGTNDNEDVDIPQNPNRR